MAATRAFIAFETPEIVKKRIIEIQEELKKIDSDTRWETADKFHVTVKFLGDVKDAILPEVLHAVDTILGGCSPFEVSYSGIGGFPNLHHPRVLWIGCKNPDGKLQPLKDALDAGLAPWGFEREQRAFHPHITLGRIKSDRGLKYLTPILEKLTFEPHEATINGMNVMKSILRPQGAQHTVLRTIAL